MEKHRPAKVDFPDLTLNFYKVTRASSFSGVPTNIVKTNEDEFRRDSPVSNLLREYNYHRDIVNRDFRKSFMDIVQAFEDHKPMLSWKNWKNNVPNSVKWNTTPPAASGSNIGLKSEDEDFTAFTIPGYINSPLLSRFRNLNLMESPLLDKERNRRSSLKGKFEMNEKNNDTDEETPSPVIRKNKYTLKNSCNFMLFCLVLSLFFGVVSIILQQETNRHSSDFADAAAELNKRIYGQEQAVKALSRFLMRDHPPLKVIAVVGGTGVGKSYTVEIVKQNFPRGYFVSQFFSPINSADSHFVMYPQLIVLENLRQHDLMSVKNFLKTLQMSESERYITVIAVFNFEQMDDNATRSIDLNGSVKMLQNFFADENIDAKVIPYHSLRVDALEKCIFDAMKNTGLELSAEQVDAVKQHLIRSNAGCKGAHAKVQLVARQVK